MQEIMEVTDKISDLNIKWSTLRHERDLQDRTIADLEKEVEVQVFEDKIPETEDELDRAITAYNEEVDQRHVLAAASTILKDGGIKAKIIKQYVPIINKLINKYLSAMDFFVQFELNEQFEETIKSRFRDEFSYASFSEGEKMRINLAVLFTWRAVAKIRNSINTNLLIMDEVFDSSLDSGGTEEFMKILTNLTQDTNTFIISHKGDQLSDKFERVIKFEKHKNFSRIAQ
jgi:ABC-type phosphate transport system ATPase subunit